MVLDSIFSRRIFSRRGQSRVLLQILLFHLLLSERELPDSINNVDNDATNAIQ